MGRDGLRCRNSKRASPRGQRASRPSPARMWWTPGSALSFPRANSVPRLRSGRTAFVSYRLFQSWTAPGMRTVNVSRSSVSTIWQARRDVRDRPAQVEHVVFVVACGRQPAKVLRGDDDMAGRAGHRAFAAAFERLAGGLRHLKQPRAGWSFNFAVEASIGFQKPDPCHAGSTPCARAASSIRPTALASPSSPT